MEELDVQKRRPVNVWTREQKLALLLLVRLYLNQNWDDLRRVFQKIFHSDLLIRGFFKPGLVQIGITKEALRAQQIELRRNKSTEYVEVYTQTSFDELEGRFSSLNARLLRAARDEGVNLVARQFEFVSPFTHDNTIQTSNRARSPSVSDAETESTLLGDLYDSDEEETLLQNPGKSASNPARSRNRIPDVRIPKHDGLPFLAFRVSCDHSAGLNSIRKGFTSGAHVTDESLFYSPIPHGNEARLVNLAAIHLNKQRDADGKFIPSPLISLSDSLIWSISRCVQLEKQRLKPRITMFNVPAIASPIFEASTLCKDMVLQGKRQFKKPYYAANEYFVWGQITPGAAIIGDVSFKELKQLVRTDSDVAELVQMELIEEHHYSVAEIRKRFSPPSLRTGQTATAIGKLYKFFKRNTWPNDPSMSNFTRVVLQNWKLAADLDMWREDTEFVATLKEIIYAPTVALNGESEVLRQSHIRGVRTLNGVSVIPNYSSADNVPVTPTHHIGDGRSPLSLGLPTPETSGSGRAVSGSQHNALLNSPCGLDSDLMECDSPRCQLSSRL